MKKTMSLILVIVMISIFTPSVSADTSGLMIDNAHEYEGMSKAYFQGYKPTISGGKAIIILPLWYNGAIVDDSITASISLGSTNDSPFVYANYEKTVTLQNNLVGDGTSAVSSYLVKFEIPLSSKRIMGTYPVEIKTSYATATSDNVEQIFTIYVTISDGVDPSITPPPPEESKPPAPRPEPKIIVTKYIVRPDVVTAGEAFDLDIYLLNTEVHWHTKNIVVAFSGETADILPDAGTNIVFIDEIEDNQTHKLTLKLKTRVDAEARPQKVLITIEYEDSARMSYTVNEEIMVEIQQPIRLEYDEVNLPQKVNAGDSLPISMQMFNMGKSTLYNVLCTLDMPGVIPEGSAYLGNMESGTSGTAEIYAFFGTLDMGENASESGEKYGVSQGTMTITYEDEYGNVYEEKAQLSITIERPVFDDIYTKEEVVEEEHERASQWWVSIIALLGIGMIIYGVTSYRRKVNRLRREYGDENI